jgi:glycosyltransferase involved in cell wall biosynthesis
MKVCVVKDGEITLTETFIRAHIDGLPEAVGIHGNPPRRLGQSRADVMPYGSQSRLGVMSFWESVYQSALHRLGLRRFEDRHHTEKYQKLLSEIEPDAVLAEFGPTGIKVSEACASLDIPLVVFFHAYEVCKKKMIKKYKNKYKKLFEISCGVLCSARSIRERVVEVGSSPGSTFVCAGSGVATEDFNTSSPADALPRFVHVGRFVDKKAPHLTLLAFSRVLDENEEASLQMVGDGPLLGACKDLAISLGIDQSVSFRGACPHEEVRAVLSRAGALVQHSVVAQDGDSEGTPMSVLEAGASGIPVVVTRHSGLKDAVVENETGFLVEERDIRAMADRMLELASNPGKAREMGEKGRKRAEKHFTEEKNINRISNILKWSANKKREKPPIYPKWANN